MSFTYSHSNKPLPRRPKPPQVYSNPLDILTDDEDDENDEDNHERKGKASAQKPWKPITLHTGSFALMLIITVALIVAIAWLLMVNNRDQGVILAQDVNALPLRRSFWYLYLPTIISVTYGFLWSWVDLDIKRLEPYFQLSRSEGAHGAESLLLAYPLEFLLTLPFIAYKHKHWSVLSVSVVVMLVFWGLTPIQAGIFATRTINVHEEVPGYRSIAYTPIAEQGNLSAVYAQSVYNIAWLNETLPPLMTKEYVLGAFKPISSKTIESANITYSGATYAYSVDISCTDVKIWKGDLGTYYNSSNGCSFYAPPYRPIGGNDTSKVFDTMYVGYQNQNGLADYYLSSSCGENFLHSFFVRWSETTPAAILSGNLTRSVNTSLATETSLFCEPTYYKQMVNATISMPNNSVIASTPISDKLSLPNDMFNSSQFEWMMSAGAEISVRGDYPTTTFPSQKTHLMSTALNLEYLPKMAPFAIATYQRPLQDYLDRETLRLSYQSAYRLLFSRQLVDILLDQPLYEYEKPTGQQWYVTQAIVVVPGFAYAAIALLGLVLLLTVTLTIITPRRHNKLSNDPGTIGALMDSVNYDQETIDSFSALSATSTANLEKSLTATTFQLSRTDDQHGPAFRLQIKPLEQNTSAVTSLPTSPETVTPNDSAAGIRPFEFKRAIGVVFFILQVAAVVTFTTLFVKARHDHGLRLPSQSTLLRQLVENYIPIALATLIEPFWLLLNRLLCLLQPYEQLRRGGAAAPRSIDLDYSSLPPQFLFWRAARARHWLVLVVCSMVLAANVLSVALSGLMYEGTRGVPKSASFVLPRAAKFVSLNGTGLPFNTNETSNWQGGTTSDQFYSLMSNLTAGTALPPWVDEDYAYLAVDTDGIDSDASLQLETIAFGASIHPVSSFSWKLHFTEDAKQATLDVSIPNGEETTHCKDYYSTLPSGTSYSGTTLRSLVDPQPGHVAFEFATMLANNESIAEDLFCRQHLLVGWIRSDWKVTGTNMTLLGLPVMNETSRDSTILLYRPTLHVGPASIEVASTGHVQRRISSNTSAYGIENYFASSPYDLTAQAHQFMPDMGATWHKDAYPSDFLNYLIIKSTNDTSMVDASSQVPSEEHAYQRFSPIYRRLFAILIGSNQDLLFEQDVADTATTTGQIITPQTRILFSLPAFIIVEAILVCYLLTTIYFYVRRPWRILPRLPSSIASNIAFFAASRAFQELCDERDTSEASDASRSLRRDWRWAFGSFIGVDGKPHVGIEREPFITVLKGKRLPAPPAYTP